MDTSNIISLLILCFLAFLLLTIIHSYLFIKKIIKDYRTLGYKVYDYGFQPYAVGVFSKGKLDQQLHGDAAYFSKHELSAYDLGISSSFLQPMVEIINPQLIKEFYLKANEGYYIKRLLGFGEISRIITKDNLLLSEGDTWKNRRKILSSVFNYDFIKSKIPEIQAICRRNQREMEEKYQISDGVYCYEITGSLLHSFSEIILKCFFHTSDMKMIDGVDIVDYSNQLLETLAISARKPINLLLGPKFAKLNLRSSDRELNASIHKFRSAVKEIIQERVAEIKEKEERGELSDEKESQDIIKALLKKNKGNNSEYHLPFDTLINEFITFMLAGSETTMAFTRMMIYRLAVNPEAFEKVKKEIGEQITEDSITYENLKNLKYLECVQKEVLRMDSSIGMIFPRIAQKDHYLGQIKLFKGMVVAPRIRGIHFKEQEYQNALEFRPQRWLDTTSFNPYSYIPFSAGGRICIGLHLSLLENKVYMVELLRKYKSIQIDIKNPKMKNTTLYGPEPVKTTYSKY